MTVIAHVGGIPIEETLGMYGPALLLALGAASARVRARLRRVRGPVATVGSRKARSGRRAERQRDSRSADAADTAGRAARAEAA
jgi:hypothetical protein